MADAASLHREMVELVERKDFAGLRDLYHPDYRYWSADGQEGGIDAGVAVAETYTAAFPDIQLEITSELSTGDRSVVEFTARGTHQGELDGIAPTGRSVEVQVCNLIEVRDGKIVLEREYFDSASMLRQLGIGE